MDYLLHVLVLVMIYGTLAVSLDLLLGHAGLLSLAHGAFFGIGAYVSAYLTVHLGTSIPIGILGAIVAAAALSVCVSGPAIRLRDDYFVLATFALQIVVASVFTNWVTVTGGPLGIASIPSLQIPLIRGSAHAALLISATLLVLTYFGARQLTRSPFGRVIHALRDDAVLTASLGKDHRWFKVSVALVSASIAGACGAIFAHYITYIDPLSFGIDLSLLLVTMVIAGGPGTGRGPLLGAVVLISAGEALAFVGFPAGVAANLRQALYGLLLVLLVMYRSTGVLRRQPIVRL